MSIEDRIDKLESIEEIKKLKHIYMKWCDVGYPPKHLGPLFVEDATWNSETFGHYENRKKIEDFFGGISSEICFAAHLAMNFIIDVEGNKAKSQWRMLMPCTMIEDGNKVSRWILGDYNDTHSRVDGKWYFSSIDFVVNYNVPSQESWAGKEIVRS
tara:strand:+ start:541 stop:1008 length:468 start_codon:yes stop_codon:yes gene_type:complete